MQSKVYNDLKISNVDLFNLISKDFSDLNIEQFDLNLNIENCDPNIDYIYLKSTSQFAVNMMMNNILDLKNTVDDQINNINKLTE